jgi:hypothetical protein
MMFAPVYGSKSKYHFLKEPAKNFYLFLASAGKNTHVKVTKVFWFFFSKKNILACLSIEGRVQPVG